MKALNLKNGLRTAVGSVLAIGVLGLAGCDPLKGNINVVKEFSLIVGDANCVPGRGGSCPVEKKVKIPVGTMESKVDFQSKRAAVLTVKVDRTSNSATFNIPKDKNIPERTGEFVLSARESGQPVDLAAGLTTQEHDSGITRGVEQCSYTRQERVCYPVPAPVYQDCRWESRTFWGYQEVEYYIHYTDRFMRANLLEAGTQNVVAQFNGEDHDSRKVYTYQGICR